MTSFLFFNVFKTQKNAFWTDGIFSSIRINVAISVKVSSGIFSWYKNYFSQAKRYQKYSGLIFFPYLVELEYFQQNTELIIARKASFE